MPLTESFTLGIDLVELRKAQLFYRRHRKQLHSFLTSRETSFIRKNQKPYERLAVILAAKEAVLKAIGMPEAGPRGFWRVRIVPGKAGRLFFSVPELSRRLSRRLQISYSIGERFVVAQCVGIS